MSKGLRAVVGVVALAVSFFVPAVAPWLAPLGASLLLGAAMEKKPSSLERLSTQDVMIRSAVQPQDLVLGTVKKSGPIVYFGTSGTTNEFLWFVVAVCEHEIDGYETLWIDDVPIDVATEIDGSGYVTNAAFINADSTKLVKTGFYTGQSSQTADAELSAAFTEWDSTHNGNDVAYFWVRCEIDRSAGGNDPENPEANVWDKGWPRDLSVTMRGALVYDPRLDDLQTGIPGSGSHRVDTPSTWEYSENPALCRAHYIRHDRFGPGFTSSDVDWVTLAAQADICDELVSIPGAATQKRYTMNGVVSMADTPKAILESMATADHGVTLFLPAGIQIMVGAWKASTYTLTEDWLAGTVSATSALPTDDHYNGVRGQYISKDADFTLVEFQPRISSAYETEDGIGRVWSDIVLPFTNEEFTAQRLAIIELKKSRQQASVILQCNYKAIQIPLYDVVGLSFEGFSNDTFRVIGKTTNTDGIVTLQLREEVSTDWDYTVPDMAEPPVIPTVTRGSGGPLPPTNLVATTVGNGVLLEWEHASIDSISHIEVYAATSNNRAGVSLLTRTRAESFLHVLAADEVRYYWIIARGENGLVSTWEPVGSTSGVMGTAGSWGVDGSDAVYYYIKPINGTAIKNGTGSLTVEAHKLTGAVDEHLSAGTIKLYVGSTEVTEANGYGTGSDGYTGVFEPADISGAVTVELKDGPAGTVLDTITLVDIDDGLDQVFGYIEPTGAIAWVLDNDQTTWAPTSTTVNLECTFVKGGSDVARVAWQITRSAAGILTGASVTHSGGDLNTSRVTVTELDENTAAMSVKFTYSFDGDVCVVLETVTAAKSGSHGISTFLTKPSIAIATDYEGDNYSLAQVDSANPGLHKVYLGGTDETTNAIHSIPSYDSFDALKYYKTQNGLMLTVERYTGKYYVSGASWSSDSEQFTVRASYDGIFFDKVFSIVKVKNGLVSGVNVELFSQNLYVESNSGPLYGFFVMDNDGGMRKASSLTSTPGASSDFATWLINGAASDYDIRITYLWGDTFTGLTSGTWYNMAVDRYVYLIDSDSGGTTYKECCVQVDIRSAFWGTILDTCQIVLKVNYNSAA